jgi:hypothetical protein
MQREYTSVAYLPAFDTATRKLPEGGPTLFLLPEPPFELQPVLPENFSNSRLSSPDSRRVSPSSNGRRASPACECATQ